MPVNCHQLVYSKMLEKIGLDSVVGLGRCDTKKCGGNIAFQNSAIASSGKMLKAKDLQKQFKRDTK